MIRACFFIFACLLTAVGNTQKTVVTDVLVIGGGTGGTAAGIQSARSGVRTAIVEAGPWLGGMISAAGVSAVDGNHRLPSGLWAEFRSRIYQVYGGPRAVETGWVSNTLFEPRIADSIFKSMASAEKLLSVYHNYSFVSLRKAAGKISSVLFKNSRTGEALTVQAKVFIDATELGDVMKAAGVGYDLGMEASSVTGEKVGVTASNDIVQDLTYVATLKDFGAGTDRTIPRPANYDPAEFDGACTDYYHDTSRKAPNVDAKKMLDYGRLPNNKFMINWPGYGNDTYLNIVEMTAEQREKELVKAKETTLRFVYFIQHQLGFKNLGLADDEFPTADRLALMPYHREGRRVKGLVRFTMRHIAEPYTYGDPLHRTGVSVGDYPIDHHHRKNPDAPQHLEFYPIPSFNVPLGALIPKDFNNLIIAEKGISVSNVANGTTRLQPCVLLTGQAAGALAALSVSRKLSPGQVPVRTVQEHLLKAKAYIMPYIDVTPDSRHWEAVQKIGATGILKGTGIPYKWANQTWFYPDSAVKAAEVIAGLNDLKKGNYIAKGDWLTIREAIAMAAQLNPAWVSKNKGGKPQTAAQAAGQAWSGWGLKDFNPDRNISRLELAVLFQNTANPFSMKTPDHKGYYKPK
ncbi:MAG TPA: FAD-dependent oxidoreductase [Flavisolibacter sp.]|nr:FAD-dependent oxidoreductase [Flavisolibacter sp.]